MWIITQCGVYDISGMTHVSFTVVHFILLGASAVLTVYYSLTKNWIASNVFGLCFSINAIQLLSLDSFKTGMIMLSGLFFYDIFWVFGTEVMVSVAKNFDAPIKVIWPRNIIGFVLDAANEEHNFTMLGLGDIVIPGMDGLYLNIRVRETYRMGM